MPDPAFEFIDDVMGALKGIYSAAGHDAVNGLSFDFLDPLAEQYAKERGAELIGRKWIDGQLVENPNADWAISRTTRDRTNELLQQAMDEGWSPQKFAERLDEAGLYGEARAEMIARTEVAIAQSKGQVETMKGAGYDRVYVYDSDYDDECAAVDGKVASIAWAEANPTAHPNAVFEGTEVLTLGSVHTGYRAEWDGPAVRLVTAMGNDLTVSPNHPVLTGRGWVKAKSVRKGDNVICYQGADRDSLTVEKNLKKRPSVVEKVFDALGANGAATLCPTAPTHFHGDGNFCKGYVDVVWTDSPLSSEWDAPFLKDGDELVFTVAGAELGVLAGGGSSAQGGEAAAASTGGGVSLLDVGRIRVARAQDYPALLQPVPDDQVADAKFLRELESRFAVSVALDEIVEVGDVEAFSSHAYDLSTGHRTYFACGILVHNCVRSFSSAPEDEPIDLQ